MWAYLQEGFYFSFLLLLFFLPQNMKQKINRTEKLHWMLWRETEDQSSHKRPGLTGWEKRGSYHFFTLLLQLYEVLRFSSILRPKLKATFAFSDHNIHF